MPKQNLKQIKDFEPASTPVKLKDTSTRQIANCTDFVLLLGEFVVPYTGLACVVIAEKELLN